MNRKSIILLGVIIAAIVLIVGGFYLPGQEKPKPEFAGIREQVRMGIAQEPLGSLVIIAEEQGFFSQEGLDVTITGYPSGKRAMEGMFNMEIDVATTAETPVVINSFDRHDFRIVASIGSLENYFKIVARKDRGIQQPADLLGKHIATQGGSAMHFFLHLFLIKNGLSDKDVNISFIKIEELPKVLVGAEVDAITAREPTISETKKLLQDNVIVFAEPKIYRSTDFLVVLNDLINNKPEVIERILRALIKAEEFEKAHPEQSVKIVSKKLGINESDMPDILNEITLEVSLDQSFLIALEDEARWAIKNNLTNKTEIPNYLDYIYADGLKSVKPEAVNIIH